MKFSLLITTLFFFSSCKYDVGNISSNSFSGKKANISIIYNKKDTYKYDTIILKGGGKIYNPEPEIIATEFTSFISKTLASAKRPDSFLLKPASEEIVVEHSYHGFQRKFIFLQKGDSVVVNYNNGIPYYNVSNRKISHIELNLDESLNDEFLKHPDGFYERSHNILISLLKEDSISNKYFIARDYYNLYQSALFHQKLFFDPSQFTTHLRNKLLQFSFYRKNLSEYSINLLNPPIIKLSNGSIVDSRSLFDLIAAKNSFTINERNYLLYNNLDLIGQNFSINDFLKYTAKFKSVVKDSAAIKSINDKFPMAFSASKYNANGDLNVLDLRKKLTTLREILERKKDSIVYLDFWASWCLPCIKVMPYSVKLREIFKHKKVAVVYISLDKNYESWDLAITNYNLKGFKENYIGVNMEQSDFAKAYKIREIPRYMIFDKNGNLYQANAFGPESKETVKSINELLKSN